MWSLTEAGDAGDAGDGGDGGDGGDAGDGSTVLVLRLQEPQDLWNNRFR